MREEIAGLGGASVQIGAFYGEQIALITLRMNR